MKPDEARSRKKLRHVRFVSAGLVGLVRDCDTLPLCRFATPTPLLEYLRLKMLGRLDVMEISNCGPALLPAASSALPPLPPVGRPLRFHPLKDLLAAFLERAKALMQGMLNRFGRCRGVAS